MHRYFIQLSYKGTAYHGWQVQENTPETVQQVLNESLSTVLNETVELAGCGRTDSGVHAKDYYAHFDLNKDDLLDKKNKWLHKFNTILPADISILNLFNVHNEASARFDAIGRTYEYIISKSKNPFLIEAVYFNKQELDIDKMNAACKVLFDFIDFSCFSKSNTQTFTNNCKIKVAKWERREELLVFTIKADRFLRNMVRAIVGTMIDIGKGKVGIEDFKNIIESKNRSEAGFSVPASGLYLTHVEYPKNYFNE